MKITLKIDGVRYDDDVEPRLLLVHYLRERAGRTGTPIGSPSVAATNAGNTTNVYVSWNGATQVASWLVLAGSSPEALRAVVTAAQQGFETQIPVAAQPYVAVQALDSAGRALATSTVVHVP